MLRTLIMIAVSIITAVLLYILIDEMTNGMLTEFFKALGKAFDVGLNMMTRELNNLTGG